MGKIFTVIPAYEPDERLISLLEVIKKENIGPVVLVDDGSGVAYRSIFDKARELIDDMGGCLITHEFNKGKGCALKTAFSYLIKNEENVIGVVTADSDGQHTAKSIKTVADKMLEFPETLILGSRKFDGQGIPWKSRFGNKLTVKVFSRAMGVYVADTQTGLRGIPASFIKDMLNIRGDHFEFEMCMLLDAAERYPIKEIPIETIYENGENSQTHFNPLKDSVRIYKPLLKKYFKTALHL